MIDQIKSDGVKAIVSGLMQLDNFIQDCRDVLIEHNEPKVSLLFERGFLKDVISGYLHMTEIVKFQVQSYETVCVELLKVSPESMDDIIEVKKCLEGRGDDVNFFKLYTRFADLKSELESVQQAIDTLQQEVDVDISQLEESRGLTEANYDEMLYDVDTSVMN